MKSLLLLPRVVEAAYRTASYLTPLELDMDLYTIKVEIKYQMG